MDVAKAKKFIYVNYDADIVFESKNLETILEYASDIKEVFAVVETATGNKLFYMDYGYDREPIIMRVFIHYDFFMRSYNDSVKKVI